ncbi:MAG: Hsp20/alpha crystallin family protein [Gammaproteobacteria bacterium]|nr:Hsp20/alpha crystallin family protein [Gammaproteobacteria bacterium]
MSLIRYENRPFSQFQRELSRFFDERSDVVTSDWAPRVDIKEYDDKFVLDADVPGVDPKDIDITMEDGVLSLRGKRELQNVEERKNFRRVERSYGSFYRRFSLPETVDGNNIKAKAKDGVLTVEIPKLEKVQPRRIEIKH